MTDDWIPDAMSEARAEARADGRDRARSRPERTLTESALQVDDDVQQVRPGLEGFRVRGEAALCLDHRGQLVRKIDIRLLQRAGQDGAAPALAGKTDLHVS